MKTFCLPLALLMPCLALAGPTPAGAVEVLDLAGLQKLNAKFAPVDLSVDVGGLSADERRALTRILQAAQLMDPIFLRQTWAGNEALLEQLSGDTSALGRARLQAFLLNKGPWSRLDPRQVFLPGLPPRPPEGNFYPAGATREEVEAWMKGLPPEERAQAAGYFTTLRRGPDGRFQVVPYSVEYQGELARAAAFLREAAGLTAQPTLKAFLQKRADAFLSNDYYASDVAWMELDASIEPTIGPYEVYEDGWFNAKAGFEAFITLRDEGETKRLARFSSGLQDVEDHLPIDPKLRNPKLGALAPIRVVNSLYCSGDGNHGVQTAAYNLPNDERITAEKGAKRVLLRNVQQAKFQKVLLPIAKVALSPADQKSVSFDAFFTHILMHELMHGLGPHNITVAGRATTVRQSLEELSSSIEEAKADISGLFAMQYLIDKGVLEKSMERTMYTTFLASCFRAIRFGLEEAHGKGIALQLNSLLDSGAFKVAKDGTFSVDPSRARAGVEALTRELLTLEASGDKARARALLEQRAVVRPEVKRVLDRLGDVPVDISPRFVTAEKLLAQP